MGAKRESLNMRPVRWGALAVATAVMAAPTVAQATTTRVYTLGAMNRFVVDDANRWLYPHTITKYGSLFYVELFGSEPSRGASAPTSNRQSANSGEGFGDILDAVESVPVQQSAGGGVILALTDDLFISAHLSDYENPAVVDFLDILATFSAGSPLDPAGWVGAVPPDVPAAANRKMDLFLAYQIPDLAQFGLQFSFGSSKYNRNPNTNDPQVPADANGGVENRFTDNIGTSELAFVLGAGFDISEAASIDASLGFNIHSLTYRPNDRNGLIDGGGGFDFRFDARSMIGVTDQWELIPAMSFRVGGFSAADLADFSSGFVYTNEQVINITDVSTSHLLFDLGMAARFKPKDTISFWGAAGLLFANQAITFEHQDDDDPNNGIVRGGFPQEFGKRSVATSATPYLRVAMEAQLFYWLDVRAGVVKYVRGDTVSEELDDVQDTANDRLNDVTRDYPFFDYFVGFAAHYEGFFLDLQIDPLWFQRGPELLSGASGSGGGNMFVNASLGYKF